MNRRLALLAVLGITFTARGAAAEVAAVQGGIQRTPREEVTIGYQGLPYKVTGETPTGIQLGDGVLMHVGAGAEAGYDTNVFYSSSAEGQTSSPIYRTTLFASVSNASRAGAVAKQLAFDARAGLTYRRYQFDSPGLDDYRNAWMPNAGLALSVGSGQLGFGFADTFNRLEDPPYSVGQRQILRYNNQASVEGRWSPGGGRLTSVLRYTNMIDIFSNPELSYANSMSNVLMFDASWRWLPKTALFVNVQQGYIFYLNEADAEGAFGMGSVGKVPSFPLRATTGLRGLLTEKTSAVVSVGYLNSFYSSGASTAGFLGSTFAEVALTVRPTVSSRFVVGYRHDFNNSIIAAFSYDETVYASYVQQIASRLALDLSARYVHRDFQGFFAAGVPTERVDNFVQGGASLDYFLRNWMYVGGAYALLFNDSSLPPLAGVPAVDFIKHQMFFRLGITY